MMHSVWVRTVCGTRHTRHDTLSMPQPSLSCLKAVKASTLSIVPCNRAIITLSLPTSTDRNGRLAMCAGGDGRTPGSRRR